MITEKEYILLTNLANVSNALAILRNVMDYEEDTFHEELSKARNILYTQLDLLQKKVKVK